MITNLRYADGIIPLATSEAELQELVDRLDRVSRKYSLLINVDKTKMLASDDIACRIVIQNEQLELVDTFPYLGSLITEDGECKVCRVYAETCQSSGGSGRRSWQEISQRRRAAAKKAGQNA